jgi:hypothetical protein
MLEMMATSFISTAEPPEFEDARMRSDRLTRKTHFRKLPHRDMQRAGFVSANNTSEDSEFMDLTLMSQGSDDTRARCIVALSDLMGDAFLDAGETTPEAIPCFQSEYDALLWCAQIMNDSPTARLLCNDAQNDGWSVGLSDLKNEGFYINVDDRVILLDHFALAPSAIGRSAFFRHVMLTTFMRALRDVWHDKRLGDIERDFAPEQILMLERARAADCDTTTILCGWELRAAGHSDVWRHLLGSEEGDMAVVFTRFLERDPGALFSGAALAYAFRQWYADTARVDAIDHDTLETLDCIIEESDDIHPFGNERLNAAMIEELSLLPDGTCYLAGLGQGILRDPYFAGLHDMINQTHLFQMIYDMQVVMVNNVPFRDASLARMIFPQSDIVRVR